MTDQTSPHRPNPDPLVIRDLEFIGGMATVDGWRPQHELPEIAFAGRSNVGKSSLLNRLVKRKAFARVSNTPGRTRELNFFRVNRQFVLVDLPGYGYAKISKERRAEWRPLISNFLRRSPTLRGIVQLLDVRHDPTAEDHAMFELLADTGTPTIVVRPPAVHLVAYPAESSATDGPLTLDITRIQKVKLLDSSFTRRANDGTRAGG